MATPILMPKQGNSVEECLIVAWKKKVGDTVSQGEALAEMETDKATFDLESPAAGKILALFVSEGELAPVLTNVGVIGNDGEDVEPFRPKKKTAAAAKPAGGASAPATAAAPVAAASVTAPGGAVALAPAAAPVVETLTGVASPRAQELAKKYGVDYSRLSGSGPNGRVVEADIRRIYQTNPRRSYLARKLLAEGYELGKGAGSGVAGLIRGGDLRKGQPLSNVRKVIAQRMSASLKEHAQLTLNASACAEKLLACRAKLKADTRPGMSGVTIGDLIMLAVVDALQKTPEINCEYSGGKIYAGKGVSIAFACDTPKGLLVPVVHGADKMSLLDISLKVKQLAGEAQAGNISPDNLEGGTFTVSNLGSFGIESFTPVLNAPQVAILGVCAPVLRPVRAGGEVVFKDFIGFSLTIDHQVVDGAPGAKFLQLVKQNIESVDQLAGIAL